MKNDRIELIKGDITEMEVEAVVNSANKGLRGGGGVDGAIHKAAGPTMHEQCMRVLQKLGGQLPIGEAVITEAGEMPSKFVIHTVGPVWNGGGKGEDRFLTKAYRSSLQLAVDFGLKTIAFPNISVGVYDYPKEDAAQVAINEVKSFLSENDSIEKVYFVCFEDENYEIYKRLLKA